MATKPTIKIREDVGPRGVFNPNYVKPQGAWWNPETGYGGQAAPPARPIAEVRMEALIDEFKEREWDLAAICAERPEIEQVIGNHATQKMAEGLTPRAAFEDAIKVVRLAIPWPTVSREEWTAQKEVERMAADRRQRGIQTGSVTATRIYNRG